jgi:hypothetical protein
MLTLVLLFMLLNHASIRAMLILVLEIVMIYILVLIWKLPNYVLISTSQATYFPSIRLAMYPTCPFNGDHLLRSVKFPRRVFHVAWPSSVPKVFKNIGNATTIMVIN